MADQTGPTKADVENQKEITSLQKSQADYANQWLSSIREGQMILSDQLDQQKTAAEKLNETYEKLKEHVLDTGSEFTKTFKKIEGLQKSFDQILDTSEKAGQSLSKWNKAIAGFKLSIKGTGFLLKETFMLPARVVGKFFSPIIDGATSTFSKMSDLLTGLFQNPAFKVFKFIGGALVSVFSAGLKYATRFVKFMVALPLKVAGAAAKIGNSLRNDLVMTIGTAVEATKEMFDISEKYGSGAGSAIKSFADSSKDSLLEFRDITSDSVKLFGEGAAGVAARMQALSQRLGEMGAFADLFGDSLKSVTNGSADQFNFMEKSLRSLGATAEDVAYISQEAAKSGQNINTILLNMQKDLSAVSAGSNVNRKIISKNFLTMRKNIQDFGHLSTRELLETSAALTKMGLSAQDAAGMFGKLDTFESAAQMSAMLSQSFGMNLDALKLIKAENPQEIFEDLRTSMMSTGRSFEQLNRHEKSLLASTTGLSQTALKSLFDFRDAGMSYEEAMQKMKENSPEAKQLKAFEDMTGSLKEIKNIMQDTSFFSSFFKGLRTSIVLASGIGDKFIQVSKRMEEFYLTTLDFGKDKEVMGAFKSAFKPIEDTLTSLIGDGTPNNKGLFDTDILKNTVKPFMKNFAGFLGDAFSGRETVAKSQQNFTRYLNKTFNFKEIMNSPGNPGMTLFKIGGKLVGQVLKGFAVVGPGLVDSLAEGFKSLVDFIDSGSTMPLNESFKKIFNLTENDSNAISISINKVMDTITQKVLPSMFKLTKPVFRFVKDAIVFIVKTAWNTVTRQLEDTTLGKILFSGSQGTSELEEEIKTGKALGLNISDVNQNLEEDILKGGDLRQARGIGSLISIVENELSKKNINNTQQSSLNNILKDLNEIKQNKQYKRDAFTDFDDVMKRHLKTLKEMKNPETQDIKQIKVNSANDWFSDLFGGKSVVQNGPSGMSITNLSDGDQILAGMEDGPIVNAIKYSGNAVSSLISGLSNLLYSTPQNSTKVIQQNTNSQPIELVINMDGKVVAKQLIAADIVGMAKNPAYANGATVLGDGATRNQSGGSNESAAV